MKSKFKLSFNGKVMMVIISLVCVITLLMVPTLVLAAGATDGAQSSVQPRWTCLFECDNGIDYADDIARGIQIYGATITYDDYYAGVEIQLQKYTSGIWVNVPTYYWDAYEEDSYVDIAEDNISVSKGTYRCFLIHTAYDAESGFPLESVEFYTPEITIR